MDIYICNCFYTKAPDSSILVIAQYLSPENGPESDPAGALWSEVLLFHKGDLDGRDSQIIYDHDLEKWNKSVNSFSVGEDGDPESFLNTLLRQRLEYPMFSRIMPPNSMDYNPIPVAYRALTFQRECESMLVPIKDVQIDKSPELANLCMRGFPAKSLEEKIKQARELWKEITSASILS